MRLALRAATSEAGLSAAAHALVGDFYCSIQDYQAALQAYDRAVQLSPGHAAYLFNRAAVRRILGQLSEAEIDYDRVIALDPADAEACLNRSELRTQTADHNHVAALQQALRQRALPWLSEVRLRFALAKELEDLGRFAESWCELQGGATLRRKHLRYDVRGDLETVDLICRAYPETLPDAPSVATHGGPIFILGMPRTGSTLLERMLGGHSHIAMGGELTDFTECVVAAARTTQKKRALSRRELISASTAVSFRDLGQQYLSRIRRVSSARCITDKMPLNYLYCGLIRRALPTASIVHVTRHPLATCYAVYRTLFDQAYPFSYDLDELSQYYVGYHRLMAHWRARLPQQILDVSYEQLVREPEAQVRRVLEFCGLAWEPSCLEFHGRAGATTTASASQVRKPLYQSSIDLWRNYMRWLDPVAKQLVSAGIDFES